MRKTFKISTSIGVLILFMCFVNLLPIYAVTEQDTSSSKKIYVKHEEPSEYGLINEYYVDENGNRIELNLIPEDNGLHKATSLPSKFDLRNVDGKNYMTSAKDQLQTGTCWSHATMSSIESNMIMKGLGDNSTDLSEAHLVWFSQGAVTSHDINDPLYNDGISRTDYNLKLDAFYKGGTPFDAMMSLASWKGAVLESSTYTISDAETFKKNNQTTFIDDSQRYNSVVHLTNANVFDGTDSTNIKQQLMKTGAMYFSYHAPTDNSEQSLYYNKNNYSYYQTKFVSSNHAVTLVGWDDSYPKENFNIQPDTDGAWICKTVGELISVIMVTSIFHIVISRLLRLVALRQLALIFIILYINMMDLVTHITGVPKKQTFFKLKKMKIYQLYRFILVMLVLHMKFQYTN